MQIDRLYVVLPERSLDDLDGFVVRPSLTRSRRSHQTGWTGLVVNCIALIAQEREGRANANPHETRTTQVTGSRVIHHDR